MAIEPDTLAVGLTLPQYRVRAKPPAEPHENKIHDEEVARQLGFKAALVPGVNVYAWMTRPVVEALGAEWLERGSFSVRFARPIYYGEEATVTGGVSARTDDSVTIEASALNSAGEVCATATFGLSSGVPVNAPDLSAYPRAPLPAERPPVSRELLAGLSVLGTPELDLDKATALGFLVRFSESLPIYSAASAPAHPAIYLDQANRAVDRNVRVSPWIHVESHGEHLSVARVGERLATRAKIARLWERKGHEFVELDLLLVASGSRPVASIRHTAIYTLRQAA
ncbi:MAG: MaoC family dehydratase [Candidatus Rokubacteria bacterium]|nr:MaoC family dehydratase [Candidatus Rokubacteria bacterium]